MTNRHLFSFGHGYSARTLAKRLVADGWAVTGTTRSEDKAAEFAAEGVRPVVLPQDDIREGLATATHLLISASPTEDGDPLLHAYKDALAQAQNLEWIGYLSTTGVYGDHGGDWVDEATTLTPATKRGLARVEAEAQWKEFSDETGVPLAIFRLAGIYGPGRGPFAKVRSGKARRIIKKNQIFSRIHVEDIALVVKAAMERGATGAFNVCDDLPAPPEDVIGYAADLLGLPLPPEEDFETADMTPMARSFYAESKKVRNDRMKNELGVTLIYPDYMTGLRALLKDE